MTTPLLSQPIRAVVFDLDGLMLNTEDVFHQSGNELMRRRGKLMTQECHHQMIGRRPHEAFAILVEMMELTETIDELLAESKLIFTEVMETMLAPMPGLYSLLDHLDERKLPKGVATSSPRTYLEEMLTRFDLHERFVMTLTAEDVTHGKPHPEIYENAAEMLGIEPQEMLVLEDSEAGTRAASAAGAIVVSIPHQHTEHQDFSMASHRVKSLDDLLIRQLLEIV